jgi:hypothetical protein
MVDISLPGIGDYFDPFNSTVQERNEAAAQFISGFGTGSGYQQFYRSIMEPLNPAGPSTVATSSSNGLKLGGGSLVPLLILGGGAVAAFFLLRKK